MTTYNNRPFSDVPKAVKILDIIEENSLSKTYVLDVSLGAKPGQFVTLWIPGVDEKPFSVAFDDGKKLSLLIAAVGKFTKELAKKKVGDRVGIRGAFGNPFTFKPNQKIALLGGGYGTAPLYYLAYLATQEGCEVDFIMGARSKDLLCYEEMIHHLPNTTLHIATDDGSAGHHGYNTQVLQKLMEEKKFDSIKTCGPEMMMKVVSDLAHEHGIHAEIDMERYMKCGFGVCGNCCNDGTGEPSCKKGTVMDNEYVRTLPDFGQYHRDAEGTKHYL